MNRIIKILIASDFVIYFAWGLLTPIFAVFITRNIRGGTLAVIGIAEAIFLASKSICQLIFADYLDIEPSDKKNLYWAISGSFIFSFAVLLYLVCYLPIHLYLVELVLGVSSAMAYPSWYALFIRNLNPRKKAFSLSFHNTSIDGGTALAAAIGGLIANCFGFPVLIYLVAALSLVGTFLLIVLYKPLNILEQKEMAESKIDFLPVKVTKSFESIPGQILPIRKYGDSILRTKAKLIKEVDDSIVELAKNMLATMYKNNGCGLAAPQVGVSHRLIVIDIGDGPIILANPKILKKSRRKIYSLEGCLSFPGLTLNLMRSKNVMIEGFQITDGRRVKIQAEGLLARGLLHEIDHLDGILFIDKLVFWRKWKINKYLKELKKKTKQSIKERQSMKNVGIVL